MDRIIITSRPNKEREDPEECNNADEQPPPQLLDSPLPTPRRSCASVDAARRLRCRRDASPLRTQVPFSWESSPGVPKKITCARDVVAHTNKAREAMPPPRPRPPPGRPTPPCPGRNLYYGGNTSEASSDDDDDDRSFSDALDRISSPERIGSSFDRVTSKRFEDIFVGRATSFAKDRSSNNGRAAANNGAIDNSASGRHHSRQWRRGSMRRSSSREEEDVWTPRLLRTDPAGPMQLMQRIRMDAEAEEMTPRACGLMVFFPWSPRPAVCGFKSPSQPQSQSQHATPRARAPDAAPYSHSRRGTTLRDVIKEENEAGSGLLPRQQQQRGEKRNRDRDRWGVSSLLDTSKKYCTDARKALSKLSIGRAAMDSQSPRVNSDMRRDKLQGRSSTMPTAVSKMTQPKATTKY
ncbi:hypothetical protein PR202_gb04338 [Eleusine coracana subsp. coracana]|uniref:Uncharacterized protein n=1 Tax=Eleusine coracana subsp. coracana TaxID=191504 RepID=A0AAV5E3E2_ELECO|nr:hypothetical protein QOZ80_1BG0088660 [Eleusine coracana subsp. coracana]GJN17283.1 hypothetical protein PR202_gb04338 [Eleusine coracana subsp. coracana]